MSQDEVARLAALRSYKILDTPPEQAFDDITRLTAYLCGTPIAFVGFMDEDRLWFKSRLGWDVPEIPCEMSFCAHTLLQSDVLVVPDTLADYDRLATCPLATHGGVRFYAGVSLMSPEGHALGTLCAMDSIPRGLTPGQIEALRRLARQVVGLVESRRKLVKAEAGADSMPTDRVLGFSFWREISEQKRAWAALQHSEERLQGIISSAMDAIITTDSNQRIVVFNRAAEHIFGYSAAEVLGKPIDELIPEGFRTIHRQHIQGFAQTGATARSMYSPGTLFALRANGKEFPIEATISQTESEGERFFTVILRDISTRLRTESELRQAQKMEAIGQLAGGIAHEFNNFLGVILGYSELLSEEARDNERLARYVTDIRAATQHAGSLTRQLLTFSRRQVLETRVLDLNRCIWDAHNLLRRLVPASIDIVPVLAPNVWRVKTDASQLQQILINLVVNARDAMPQGGKVIIETANAELDQSYTSQQVGFQPGSYVLLSVTDTGRGMDTETRAHLFEPFFTTKEPGEGTGLGLATVYGIVKQSGGHLSVDSAEGKGTKVCIYLPRTEEAAGEPPIETSRPARQAAPGIILVVEDETALRRLICFSLEKRNHTVLAAKDGVETIEVFRQHSSQIQVVVTDIMMPRMDGFELRQRIAALKPNVKFLFMSGYAQIVEQHPESLEGCAFLAKPFLPEELADKISTLLAGDAAA